MALRFCTIASGSSGNSIYIGTAHAHILVDAGLSGKRIQQGLQSLQLTGQELDGIFITHEHSDHIRGAGILSRRFDIPIYATSGTWLGMKDKLGEIAPHNQNHVEKEQDCIIKDLCIHPYEIPHDANDPVGYTICTDQHKISIATDLGHITDTVKHNIQDSDVLLLESNHDVDMVKVGRYPYYLKQRILGALGHLSNESAGELLVELITGRLKHVFLGHLSEENNFPELAYQTVINILEQNHIKVGTHLQIGMALRHEPSPILELA
jgi:phosphoribosyl 1,2-cyclic phosphodiesterase